MSDYRVYDTRGARSRSHSVTARRERARPSREAVMERGRRIKRASHRVSLLCFATFAVLAGLRAGPSGASSSAASQPLRHHRTRRHVHHRRHHAAGHVHPAATTSTATPAPSGGGSTLAAQQTTQQPVVQSSGS